MTRNHYYRANNFKNILPPQINFDIKALDCVQSQQSLQAVERFLVSSPWQMTTREGETIFAGIEISWHFILAILVYTESARSHSLPRELNATHFRRIITSFRSFLANLHEAYDYPGVAPVAKYGVASSRVAYLYSVVRWEDTLVDLLRLVQRMVCLTTFSPSCQAADDILACGL